ncbi:hypothetical protein ACLKA6_018418 [Drosophila palustris]
MLETMLSRLNAAWIEFERIGESMCRHDSEEGNVDPAADNEVYERKYLETHARSKASPQCTAVQKTRLQQEDRSLLSKTHLHTMTQFLRLVQQQQYFVARFAL